MSIQSEVSRLQTAKSNLASAIESKGVAVPNSTKLDGYAALVNKIQTGGGSQTETVDVTFYVGNCQIVVAGTYADGTPLESPLWDETMTYTLMKNTLIVVAVTEGTAHIDSAMYGFSIPIAFAENGAEGMVVLVDNDGEIMVG